jgi:hypothetical protein
VPVISADVVDGIQLVEKYVLLTLNPKVVRYKPLPHDVRFALSGTKVVQTLTTRPKWYKSGMLPPSGTLPVHAL